MTTSRILEEAAIPHIVLCHKEEDKAKFIEGGTVKENRLLVTGNPRGLTFQRNTALDMMDEGEWAMFLNDDLIRISYLEKYYDTDVQSVPVNTRNSTIWRPFFEKDLSIKGFVNYAQKLTQHAAGLNIHLVGFAYTHNPLFNSKRYSYRGLCDGRAWLVCKGIPRFGTNKAIGALEDREFTALNIIHYGRILRCNWINPDFSRFSNGGYGSMESRAAEMREACKYLVETYPFMFKYKQKKGYPKGCHVTFTI